MIPSYSRLQSVISDIASFKVNPGPVQSTFHKKQEHAGYLQSGEAYFDKGFVLNMHRELKKNAAPDCNQTVVGL